MTEKRPWIRRPLREKRAHTLDKLHAPPCECLLCGVRLMAKDRQGHRVRCPGRASAHRHDTWESESRTAGRGLPRWLYARALECGFVRTREHAGERQVLLRDLEALKDIALGLGLEDEP